jgi:hypothetical protein
MTKIAAGIGLHFEGSYNAMTDLEAELRRLEAKIALVAVRMENLETVAIASRGLIEVLCLAGPSVNIPTIRAMAEVEIALTKVNR